MSELINKMINFSVDKRGFVFLGIALLAALGINSFQKLSIDAVPDITNTQVQINTDTHGLVPEESERMVTYPIEFAMNGIPGVESARSVSKYGLSQVTVVFEDGFDIYRARQLVMEKLNEVELPAKFFPKIGPISTGLGEIFHYAIEAKEPASDEGKRLEQLMELRSLQDWYIKPRLLGVKGITEVNTIGGYEKQFFVQPDIVKMAEYGLHFDDIEDALAKTNLNVGGGFIQQTGEQILVRGVGLLKDFSDIENVVVRRLSDYQVIRIGDIAKARFDKESRTGAGTLNGKESIIGTTFMLLGENSRSVSIKVAQKLEEIKKGLPDWVELTTLYDRSKMVNSTLKTVEHNLLAGAGLVALFLLLLVGDLRAAMITCIVIPISLLITFILMKWQNVSGNLMSLGALDFGIIVDGAVIVIDNCVHRLQERKKALGRDLERREVAQVVKAATGEIRSAAGFGELIVIAVFLPLFALGGIEGKMFGPMATTFIMALASALALSFTLVPALAASFLSGKLPRRKKDLENEPRLMVYARNLFQPFLELSLKFKRGILAIGVCAIALGGGIFLNLGAEFIPQLDEGDFAVQMIRPANTSIDSSIKLQRLSEKVIKSFPQVEHVFARTGASEVATDPMGVNISDTYVMLKAKDQWPKDGVQNKADLIRAIQKKLELTVPAQALLISQPVQLRFNELLEGIRADVSVKIYGDDLDKLIELSKKTASAIRAVPGAGEVESESKGKSPMLQYTPKTEELAQLGVTARPVLDAIQTAIGGREIGHVFQGVKSFPIITRLSEEKRRDLDTVSKLPVGISEGYTLPIDQLARIDYLETFSSVNRENSQRRVAVLINPATRDIESFVKAAKDVVENEVQLPEGYYMEWGGSFKSLSSAKERLILLVPLSLLFILAMLYTAFRSAAQVALIFTCAPLALIGGVLSLQVMGMPFSISAGVGFIALSGISILNGVVLVSYFNRLRSSGLDGDDLVKSGTMMRLRPVLMTALTDIFGFLPMMFSSGLGSEVQRPLATVVVGGMVSSTLLTLIIIPSLYSLFSRYMAPAESDGEGVI